jgi:predicted NAD/FAD-binding protein
MRVAVVGAGISGLGAAWLLAKDHEVHLFESEGRLGGHAHTVRVSEDGNSIPVDTGFLVYNNLTYPNLVGFFQALGVTTAESDMSLSVQVQHKGLEWNGTNLNTVFGQRSNLIRPAFFKMLQEILRFEKEAESNLASARTKKWSLRDLLRERHFSLAFKEDYLLPIGAAIWSTPEGEMLDFPAETFIQFFINHRLLQVNGRPKWRTVKNGSIEYVTRAAASIPRIHLNSPVQRVERKNGKVLLSVNGAQIEFDRVVLATHAPLTAKILAAPSDREARVLGSFRDESNRAILHRDISVMPKRKRCWASWNVLGTLANGNRKVCLSYYLNRLQPIEAKKSLFITLNPSLEPAEKLQEFSYDHPQFTQAAIDAQAELPELQGAGGVYFAGAWSRYGFHEDGLLSAVKVAAHFNVKPPWASP